MFEKPKSFSKDAIICVSWMTNNEEWGGGGSRKCPCFFELTPDSYENSFASEPFRKMHIFKTKCGIIGRLSTLVVNISSGISVFRPNQGTPNVWIVPS